MIDQNASDNAPTEPPFVVACPSTSECVVLDSLGKEVTFDPLSSRIPAPTQIDDLPGIQPEATGVACSSITFDPIAPRAHPLTQSLRGVSCGSASSCALVDYAGDEFGGPASVATGSSAAVTGIATNHQTLGFAFTEPAGYAPIARLLITMPTGITLNTSSTRLAASVHVSNAGAPVAHTVTVERHQLTLTLNTSTRAANVTISSPLIGVDTALKRLAHRRRLAALEISVATFAADGNPVSRLHLNAAAR